MKKIISIITIILICFSLGGCAFIKDDVYLVYTSDVHSNVNGHIGYAGLKYFVNELKKENSNVLLIDGGDFSTDSKMAEETKGEAIVEIMNKVGYDVVALGNHDLDYGLEATKNALSKAKFAVTTCNLKYIGNGDNPYKKVKPYVIKRIGGIKVAFVGIITPETLDEEKKSYFNNFENGELAISVYTEDSSGDELYAKVQETIDEARSKADVVVAIAHLGIYNKNVMNCDKFINGTRGVDIVLDAHAHTDHEGELWKNADGEDVVYLAVGSNIDRIGVIKINIDGTIETQLINSVEGKDANVQSFIDDLMLKYE